MILYYCSNFFFFFFRNFINSFKLFLLNFYVIKFYIPEQCINCVCQKDLIVEGTIEQFEEMFKDKIVQIDFKKNTLIIAE